MRGVELEAQFRNVTPLGIRRTRTASSRGNEKHSGCSPCISGKNSHCADLQINRPAGQIFFGAPAGPARLCLRPDGAPVIVVDARLLRRAVGARFAPACAHSHHAPSRCPPSPLPQRNVLFISKATPGDDEFVLWLAPRLEAAGYEIFADILTLEPARCWYPSGHPLPGSQSRCPSSLLSL
jgi:hypothetical protein